ncbi:MAG: YIP1 family protein [Isosphaeraceae bacterium]|nr:YIP1 family protein [Isosphaeraceae bacterium]
MGIAFSCPQCGKQFDVDPGLAGKKCRCKQCGHLFSIPVPRPAAAGSRSHAAPPVARSSDPFRGPDAPLPPRRRGFEPDSEERVASRPEPDDDRPRWRPKNPWLTVWYSPRKTVRRILKKDREQGVMLLLFLYSINRFLSGFTIPPGLDQLTLVHIVFLALFASAIGVVLTYFIAAPIFAVAGRMFGGEGDSEDVRVAFAWSSVPSITVIVFQIGAMLILGRNMFLISNGGGSAIPMNHEISATAIPLHLWSLVLFVAALAEVHRFSIAKSLGTIVIVFLGLIVLAVGLAFFLMAARIVNV